ncbi:MAG: insulinase family protein [Bacteroidota bacterium]|nr:insulinase family protein [Bacteroidota bacterium]
MKNTFLVLLLLTFTLPVFGIEVVSLPLPKSDKIVVKLMFRNGSMMDPKGMEGLSNLTSELLLDGGTAKLTSGQVNELLYPLAARNYSSTDKEVSIFTFEFHKDHESIMVPLLIDFFMQPGFHEEDFLRLKSNQLNYVNEVIRASSDEEYSKMALEDLLFRGTNYQHMVNGSTSGLEKITLDAVRDHYKSMYTADGLMLGIAGNYSAGMLATLQNAFNKLPASSSVKTVAGKANTPNGIEVEIISKTNALGSAIFAGFPLPVTRKDADFAALMVANSWLGEHRKSYSRLYQKIREQRSMNYGDYTYIEWYENGGSNMLPQPGYPRSSNYFSMWIRPVQTAEGLKKQYPELASISVGHAHFALRMALKEMKTIIDNGFTKEDFELTRDFLRSYIKLYIQTPAKQLGFLMDSKFYGRKDYIAELDGQLAKLTLTDVNAVMKKYWQTENMYVTIVTDDSEAEPLKKSLMNNDVSPMSYSDALKASLPATLLQEDEVVAKFPLNVKKVTIVDSDKTFR